MILSGVIASDCAAWVVLLPMIDYKEDPIICNNIEV